jgi:hypothetical protein
VGEAMEENQLPKIFTDAQLNIQEENFEVKDYAMVLSFLILVKKNLNQNFFNGFFFRIENIPYGF